MNFVFAILGSLFGLFAGVFIVKFINWLSEKISKSSKR